MQSKAIQSSYSYLLNMANIGKYVCANSSVVVAVDVDCVIIIITTVAERRKPHTVTASECDNICECECARKSGQSSLHFIKMNQKIEQIQCAHTFNIKLYIPLKFIRYNGSSNRVKHFYIHFRIYDNFELRKRMGESEIAKEGESGREREQEMLVFCSSILIGLIHLIIDAGRKL